MLQPQPHPLALLSPADPTHPSTSQHLHIDLLNLPALLSMQAPSSPHPKWFAFNAGWDSNSSEPRNLRSYPGSHTYGWRSDEGCGNLAWAASGLTSLTCVSQLCGAIAGPCVWLPSLSAQHPFLVPREMLSSHRAQPVTTLTPPCPLDDCTDPRSAWSLALHVLWAGGASARGFWGQL